MTSSLTTVTGLGFVLGGPQTLLQLQRLTDGGPLDHGVEIATFLRSGVLVGYLMEPLEPGKVPFNGPGDLAAQLVAHFKKEPGQFYIVAEHNRWGYEYTYEILVTPAHLLVKVYQFSELVFSGTPDEYLEYFTAK